MAPAGQQPTRHGSKKTSLLPISEDNIMFTNQKMTATTVLSRKTKKIRHEEHFPKAKNSFTVCDVMSPVISAETSSEESDDDDYSDIEVPRDQPLIPAQLPFRSILPMRKPLMKSTVLHRNSSLLEGKTTTRILDLDELSLLSEIPAAEEHDFQDNASLPASPSVMIASRENEVCEQNNVKGLQHSKKQGKSRRNSVSFLVRSNEDIPDVAFHKPCATTPGTSILKKRYSTSTPEKNEVHSRHCAVNNNGLSNLEVSSIMRDADSMLLQPLLVDKIVNSAEIHVDTYIDEAIEEGSDSVFTYHNTNEGDPYDLNDEIPIIGKVSAVLSTPTTNSKSNAQHTPHKSRTQYGDDDDSICQNQQSNQRNSRKKCLHYRSIVKTDPVLFPQSYDWRKSKIMVKKTH